MAKSKKHPADRESKDKIVVQPDGSSRTVDGAAHTNVDAEKFEDDRLQQRGDDDSSADIPRPTGMDA